MLTHLDPASTLAVGLLIFALLMVVIFEASNGFHDAANAVATVIYTRSLKPTQAVIWSGLMNFVGVLVGGIAVAYALVELLPAEVLSPPNGAPAVAMLIALFVAALVWNIGTWWFGLPNSSSHCLIGALIGVALGDALSRSRSLTDGVHWPQVWKVLEALALSPLLGFVLAGGLYLLARKTLHDPNLYKPADTEPPVWWMRGILILTCTGVSFAHGTNDGQKSIGLIMLTIIGLFPTTFSLNPQAGNSLADLPGIIRRAEPLVMKYGDDERTSALTAAHQLQAGQRSPKTSVRDDVYQIISQLKHVEDMKAASKDDKKQAADLAKQLGKTVEYAPTWVRLLSAFCLGVGTMIGYKRIVTTLGERLGNTHLTPAQGASAEVVAAVLIGVAGFTGAPVSTTHIVTSGIGGTMVSAGAGLRYSMLSRILLAWVLTLPVTIVIAATLYYVLASPTFQ